MADGRDSGMSASDSLIGGQLGGYVIEDLLGKGAMGAVYRAVQVSLNRRVALKVMAGHLMNDTEAVARFWREARAAAAINHPNLVQVYDFGESGGVYYYAMELVDGLSLGAYLRRGDRFTERECIEVGREVTLALRAAHRAGVIHRDLKPDNLMLTSEGSVKVADLGIARFLSERGECPTAESAAGGSAQDMRAWDSLTMTGVGMGTPAFMSPEQIRVEKDLDQRSDFYALGATLFQLATSRTPYLGRRAGEVFEKHLSAPVPVAQAVNPALSGAFSALLVRLMAKSPSERPQTHEEILSALEGCLRTLRGEREEASRIQLADAPADGWTKKLVRLWPAWAAAALAVVGFFLLRGPKEPEPWQRLDPVASRDAPSARTQVVAAVASELASRTATVRVAVAPVREAEGSTQTRVAGMLESNVAAPSVMAPGPQAVTGVSQAITTAPPQHASAAPVQESVKPLFSAAVITSATKDKPFVNSLGMKFVPVPGTQVLFSIWETRVKDFEAFVRESGYAWSQKPPFEQTPDDPAVMVSWDDANAFCSWLSKRDGCEYRLPKDVEWDAAVGKEKYPWGNEWPPPRMVENIAGEESKLGESLDPPGVLGGYKDDHPRTAPVGSYKVTKAGLNDMGGNVREWVQDWYTEALFRKHRDGGGFEPKPEQITVIKKGDVCRVSRGGFWLQYSSVNLVSSYRYPVLPGARNFYIGFRCALVVPSPLSDLSRLDSAAAEELGGILSPLRAAKAEADKQAAERIARYTKDIEALERRAAARSDGDVAAKLRAEREAWAAGQRPPKPEVSAKMPSDYGNLRFFLDRDLGLVDAQAGSTLKRETSKAMSSLRSLEAKLVRAGKAEAAQAVRGIRERVETGGVGSLPMADGRSPGPASNSGGAGKSLTDSATATRAGSAPSAAGPATKILSSATKDRPFLNSLGMRFVPVPGTKVLLSIWETRVKEFEAFVKDSGFAWNRTAPFELASDHPVVMVSWEDAKSFCDWISKQEGIRYRLPTDEEWDVAVGKDRYSWGDQWPPPRDVANLAGEEAVLGDGEDPKYGIIPGWRDNYPRLAPVGSFGSDKCGLYDMAGNAREWVEDWLGDAIYQKHRLTGGFAFSASDLADVRDGKRLHCIRGSSWLEGNPRSGSRCRFPGLCQERNPNIGFRCVVEPH